MKQFMTLSLLVLPVLAEAQEVARFKHDEFVNSVAFSPDGTLLASGAGANVTLWDLESGNEMRQFQHDNVVYSVAFSPDSTLVASGASDHTARVWDLKKGIEVRRFRHDGVVSSVAFSPDGAFLASGSGDHTARVWDLETGNEMQQFQHDGEVSSVAFSPDSTLLASGSGDYTVRVWDLETHNEMWRLSHDGYVTSVAFSPSGILLTSGSVDYTVRVWDLETGNEMQQFQHDGSVRSVAFSPDSTLLASGSDDRAARLWDLETGNEMQQFQHDGSVRSVAFSPDGTFLASGAWDHTARVWDLLMTPEVIQLEDVADQLYLLDTPITPFVLPEATGGTPPFAYALTPSMLPRGLFFDAPTRTILGIPTVVTPEPLDYVYTATDALETSTNATFKINIYSPLQVGDVADQNYPRAAPIAPLVLPEATGGVSPITYMLSPTILEGLSFDTHTRIIQGTPTVVTAEPVAFTYAATDMLGNNASTMFKIIVYSPTSAESESLPESFVIIGNYPNPFQSTTQLTFDLPWPARVQVEVLDVLGRRLLFTRGQDLSAGHAQTIEIPEMGLPAGVYLYRLLADSPAGRSIRSGRLVSSR